MKVDGRTTRWPPIEERLGAKLVRQPNGCLEWTGLTDADGYGRIGLDYRNVGTHRVAWELHNGPLPERTQVCHHCDNPPCCDPDHLFLGTNAENMVDKVAKKRHRFGETSTNLKLTQAQVVEIRGRVVAGAAQKPLAAEYGVTPQAINLIVKRRNWKHC
jgi:hypothetical protein